jgi:hypothetical protein
MSESEYPDIEINITIGIIALIFGTLFAIFDSVAGAIFCGLVFIGCAIMHGVFVYTVWKNQHKEG